MGRRKPGHRMPGEVLLRAIELLDVEPLWVLRGEGPVHRDRTPPQERLARCEQALAPVLRAYVDALRAPAVA